MSLIGSWHQEENKFSINSFILYAIYLVKLYVYKNKPILNSNKDLSTLLLLFVYYIKLVLNCFYKLKFNF